MRSTGYRVRGRLFLIFLNRKSCASACIFLWLIRVQLAELTSSAAPYFSCYLNRINWNSLSNKQWLELIVPRAFRNQIVNKYDVSSHIIHFHLTQYPAVLHYGSGKSIRMSLARDGDGLRNIQHIVGHSFRPCTTLGVWYVGVFRNASLKIG